MRTLIRDVGFDNVTMAQAVSRALDLMAQPGGHYVVTPNPEMLWAAERDVVFQAALNGADLCIPDGIGVVYAAAILGTPLQERVPGYELGQALMQALSRTGDGVYLLGAKPGVAEQAARKLCEAYPGLNIVGCGDGYFHEDAPVLERICTAKPRLLLVCLGFPRQEKWMAAHRRELDCLMLGLGGALDGYAGIVKRAPALWCRLNLEWLYRLLKQPSRLGRMLKLPAFLCEVFWERLRHGKRTEEADA